MARSIQECDADADKEISNMVKAALGIALVPVVVNTALSATVLGAGCVAIGRAYGITITKDEAWKLVKQFLLGAGGWFLAMNFGTKFFTMLLQATGFGYGVGVALDAAICSAAAYAIGGCAKSYFRNDYLGKNKPSKEELKRLFREEFNKHKKE